MKKLRFAVSALALAFLMPSLTSCKSDENPFDSTISSEKKTAAIKVRLSVEETRADDLSTDLENKINKVTIHVFDANHKLETTKTVDVSSVDAFANANLQVSHGLKTLYVVSEKSNVNPSVGTALTDYENKVFISSLDNLITTTGFVMVGKSKEQQVIYAASANELPASNIFDIQLVRLVAKTQVKTGNVDGSSFGISFGDGSFKTYQHNQRMRVVHNGSDVFDSEADNYVDSNNNGTYDNYSQGVGEYLSAVKDGFTASGCAYMSENIVSTPVSGNTTFLGVCFVTTPAHYYTFDSTESSVKLTDEKPSPGSDYYAVGLHDEANGVIDYALDNSNNHIITFKSEQDATNYVRSLGSGNASGISGSKQGSPLRAGSVSEDSPASTVPTYKVVKFTGGKTYYRVNIAHREESVDTKKDVFKVMRNRFYKVSINSVKSLGFNSESALFPKNPAAKLDAEGYSNIKANISVAPWTEVNQGVDL